MVVGKEGPRVQGYENLREQGSGGYATVYVAHQTAFDRDVALKVLRRPASDEDTLALFTRECRAIGRLSGHPHVVSVHDAGTTSDGLPYLAMEFLPGGSLGDALRDGPLSVRLATRRAADVADAMAAAHAIGILHRDIKPANILVDVKGVTRLVDFGIARLADATLTPSGVVSGTFGYLAPEVLRGDRASEASDVYSLGVTLATLLLGSNPFVRPGDETPAVVISRILEAPTPDLRNAGVPEAVVNSVSHLASGDAAERPSMAAARALLAAVAAEHATAEDPTEAGTWRSPHELTTVDNRTAILHHQSSARAVDALDAVIAPIVGIARDAHHTHLLIAEDGQVTVVARARGAGGKFQATASIAARPPVQSATAGGHQPDDSHLEVIVARADGSLTNTVWSHGETRRNDLPMTHPQPAPLVSLASVAPTTSAFTLMGLDSDGRVWRANWPGDGYDWQRWEEIGPPQEGGKRANRAVSLTATSSYPGGEDVFAVDDQSGFWTGWYKDGRMTWWYDARLTWGCRSLTASSLQVDHLEAFVVDSKGLLHHRWRNPGDSWPPGWTKFEPMAPRPLTAVAAASSGDSTQRLVGRSEDGSLWTIGFRSGAWQPEWSAVKVA